MRILYLHQHFCPPGGAGNNRSYELGKEWANLGHVVTIICGSGNFMERLPFWRFSKKYTYEGLEVIRLNVDYSHFMPFLARIVAFVQFLLFTILYSVRLPKYDLVYASSTPLSVGLLGIMLKRKMSARLFFETVDLWPDVPIEMGVINSKLLINYLLKIESRIYHNSERIICLSEGMRDRILQKGIGGDKVIVAHNGTNTAVFFPVDKNTSRKEAIGFKKDDFIVLYAGTIGRVNEVMFLVEVAEAIQKRGSNKIKFLIVGDGNRANQLKPHLSKHSFSNMTWLKTVPKKEVVIYFQAADIGVVLFAPYKILETNSANKFYDYLACGLPVLINYKGWQKEYLDAFKCGFSESEVVSMADRIEEMAADLVGCGLMANSARRLAIEKFDRKAMAINIAKLFDSTTYAKSVD